MSSNKMKVCDIALAVAVPLTVLVTPLNKPPLSEAENNSKVIYSQEPRSYVPSRRERRRSYHVHSRSNASAEGFDSKKVDHEHHHSPSRGRRLQRGNSWNGSPILRPDAAEFHHLLHVPRSEAAGFHSSSLTVNLLTLPSFSKTSQSSSPNNKMFTSPSLLPHLQSVPASDEPPLSPPRNEANVLRPSTPPCDGPLSPNNAKAFWWAEKSNALAALKKRAYHLSLASTYLTCKIEELTLLNEVQNMNNDGVKLYSEIVRYSRDNLYEVADWRVTCDMEARLRDSIRYGHFIHESIRKCEWEINQQVNKKGIDNSRETPVIWEDKTADCASRGTSTESSPIITSAASTCDSPVKKTHVDTPTESRNKSFHFDIEKPAEIAADVFVISPVGGALVDTSVPTWAQVAAGKRLKFHGPDWAEILGRNLGENWGTYEQSGAEDSEDSKSPAKDSVRSLTKGFAKSPTQGCTKIPIKDFTASQKKTTPTNVTTTKNSKADTLRSSSWADIAASKPSLKPSSGSARSWSPENRCGPIEWTPGKKWLPTKKLSHTKKCSTDFSGESWRRDQ